MSTDFRIRSTHVGSLVRPDELIAHMHAIDAGEADDQRAYEECLTRSVRDVVRRQRDAGVDVVSDGEYGKSSWNYYVHKRLGGFELRSDAAGRMADVGRDGTTAANPVVATDWARFPEFYADYFAHEQGEYEEPGGTWVCTGPVTYTGQAAIGRDIANLKAAMETEGVEHQSGAPDDPVGEAGGFGRRRADRLGAPGARPRIVSGRSRNLRVACWIVAAICPKSTTSPRGGRPFGRQRTWHRCW